MIPTLITGKDGDTFLRCEGDEYIHIFRFVVPEGGRFEGMYMPERHLNLGRFLKSWLRYSGAEINHPSEDLNQSEVTNWVVNNQDKIQDHING